jgi:hypothetical protein
VELSNANISKARDQGKVKFLTKFEARGLCSLIPS